MAAMSSSSDTPISTAVVTGGHFYEVVDFHRLFRSLGGVDAYIQHMDDFVAAPPAMRDGYDVVLFFTMLLEGPQGGQLRALERVSAARQGVVVLHHSILAFPYSPFWRRWTDLHNLSHSVDPPEPITTEIADRGHPITSGLADWEMVDEIYRMDGPSADSHILLAARHPHSMRALAWAREIDGQRVVCYQAGHDHQAWTHPDYRTMLERSIRWCAARI